MKKMIILFCFILLCFSCIMETFVDIEQMLAEMQLAIEKSKGGEGTSNFHQDDRISCSVEISERTYIVSCQREKVLKRMTTYLSKEEGKYLIKELKKILGSPLERKNNPIAYEWSSSTIYENLIFAQNLNDLNLEDVKVGFLKSSPKGKLAALFISFKD